MVLCIQSEADLSCKKGSGGQQCTHSDWYCGCRWATPQGLDSQGLGGEDKATGILHVHGTAEEDEQADERGKEQTEMTEKSECCHICRRKWLTVKGWQMKRWAVVTSGFGGVEVLCDGVGESQVAMGCALGPRLEASFAPSLLGKCGWEIVCCCWRGL